MGTTDTAGEAWGRGAYIFGLHIEPINQSNDQSVNQPTNSPINQSISQSINQLTNQPNNLLINQLTYRSVDRLTINQSIHQSVSLHTSSRFQVEQETFGLPRHPPCNQGNMNGETFLQSNGIDVSIDLKLSALFVFRTWLICSWMVETSVYINLQFYLLIDVDGYINSGIFRALVIGDNIYR